MYVYKFLIMLKHKKTRLLQETFKVKQIKIASRLIQAQGAGNQLPGIVINYQRHIANGIFKKGFEIWILNLVIDYQMSVIDYQ